MIDQSGFEVGDHIVLSTDPERKVGEIVGFDRDEYQDSNDIMNVAYNDTVSIPVPRYKWSYARKVDENGQTLP